MFGFRDDHDPADEGDFEAARDRMVDRLLEQGVIDRESTEQALRTVPRHEFVPESRRRNAYADRPLPIGHDQTISAPHMVAVMTDLLELERGDEVLEIGTGCGYHAATVAEIVGPGNVYTVEYVDDHAAAARERLERLGYDVHVRQGDGHRGWPEHAPYDAAYLTCATPEMPDRLVEQVRNGGVVVGPVGRGYQELVKLCLEPDGTRREQHGGVRFVPMQGERDGQ